MARAQLVQKSEAGTKKGAASAKGGSARAKSQRPTSRAMRVGDGLLQPKLRAGAVSDPLEREADRIAESALRMPLPAVTPMPAEPSEAPAASSTTNAPAATPPKLVGSARAARADEAPPELARDVTALVSRGGAPLPSAVRAQFEPRLGRDLGDVRVHTGSDAARVADAADARAFTVGNHIAFGSGEFRPSTPEGQRIVAHELAHVVQQTGAAPVLQRAPKGGDGDEGSATEHPTSAKPAPIVINELPIPKFKTEGHRGDAYRARASGAGLRRAAGYIRGEPKQRDVWVKRVKALDGAGTLRAKLEAKIKDAYALDTLGAGARWVLELPVGLEPAERRLPAWLGALATPGWGGGPGSEEPQSFEVDHIVELQLANWPNDTWANGIENMELLAEAPNGSSGATIMQNIRDAVGALIGSMVKQDIDDALATRPVIVKEVKGKASGNHHTISAAQFWKREDIETGVHLDSVHVGDPSLLEGGRLASVRVFFAAGDASSVHEIGWNSRQSGAAQVPKNQAAPPYFPHVVTKAEFDTSRDAKSPKLGYLMLNFPEGSKIWKPLPEDVKVEIDRVPGARYAGVIRGGELVDAMKAYAKAKKLEAKGASPVDFEELAWVPGTGLVGKGKIAVNEDSGKKVLRSDGKTAGPEIVLEGKKANTKGKLDPSDVKPPGPIEITDVSVSFSGGDETGLQAEGSIGLRVRDVGEGRVTATVGEKGFRLDGSLDVSSRWFKRATLKLGYDSEKGVFAGADLGLNTAGVPGLQAATATVRVEQGRWDIGGEVLFRALGFQQILLVRYSDEKGLSIGARIPIEAGKIPGITAGHLEGAVVLGPSGELGFIARGEASPAIPGVNGTVQLAWENGVFIGQGTLQTKHENLEGSVTVGLTNQAIGEDGKPAGTPTNRVVMFGGGRVGVKFGEYVRGEATVRLTPAAELVLDGAVALAKDIELFRRRQVTKRLFDVSMNIPIVGLTVMGKGVGIFATIGGGLDAEAYFGPGVLRDVGAKVHFEPAHPERTEIAGSAEFYVPAYAGLRLFIEAGIGASLLVVTAKGSIEVGATLGVLGEGRARVDVKWSKQSGLAVDALAEAMATPKFKFDVTGGVSVDAALIGNVYKKRWELAAYEFGPDLRLGVRLPIAFREGQPFSVSADQVQFIVPNVEPRALLEGLLKQKK